MKELNEEKLSNLSFVEFLEWMTNRIERIYYRKGSNNAYYESNEIIRLVINRYINEFGLTHENFHNQEIGGLLFHNVGELNDYTKYATTDKAKAEVISKFKAAMESDLRSLIYEAKRNDDKNA